MPLRRFAEDSLFRPLAVTLVCAAPAFAQSAPPSATPAPPSATPAAATPAAALDPAWIGGWIGVARLDQVEGKPSAELPLAFAVRIEGGAPRVEISSLPAGALRKPAVEVSANGASLAFTLESQGEKARFEGTVAEGGKEAMGEMQFVRADPRQPAPKAKWSMRRVDFVSEVADARVFTATLEAGAQKLPMRLSLGNGPHGWCGALDILVQGVRDFPVAVERKDAGFIVRFPAGAVATLELAPADGVQALGDMKVLEGSFKQGAFAAPIRFEVVEGAKAGALRRPQQPVPPFPYETREVKVAHPLGHTLAGTLSVPSSKALAVDGRVPGIVCVTGSGPQDRDEALMGHKPFAVLADAFARAGIAVLRYDDRGTAASIGNFQTATTADFASDADMAVEWMKRQPGIDPTRIGVLGHSEGGLIGPLVAAWQNAGDAPTNPLAFLVLLAPPGEQGGRLLTRQTKALTEAAGIAADKLGPMIAAHEALMNDVIASRAPDALRSSITALVRTQLELAGTPVTDEAALRPIVDQTLLQIASPWMTEFIRMDPKPALRWLEVPTLAVWGTKDLQVDAAANRAAFEEALKSTGAPVTMRVFDGLNHLLQPAKKGTVEEYGEIETTIDPSALEAIVGWVVATASKGPVSQVPEASRPAEVRDSYVPPRLFYYRGEVPAAPAAPVAPTEKPRP
jgi:hypothetical protein